MVFFKNYFWNRISIKLSLFHCPMRQSKRGHISEPLNFSQSCFCVNQSVISICLEWKKEVINCVNNDLITVDDVPIRVGHFRRLRLTLPEFFVELLGSWPYTAWTSLYFLLNNIFGISNYRKQMITNCIVCRVRARIENVDQTRDKSIF